MNECSGSRSRGGGSNRGRRVRDVWAALERAEDRARALDWVTDRVISGTANLSEYKAVLAEDVRAAMDMIAPVLPVVRAQRLAKVPAGHPFSDELALARRVLSYRPDEPLTQADTAAIARLRKLMASGPPELGTRRTDAEEAAELAGRLRAATALLLIGPGEGLAMRRRLWHSGFAEAESLRVDCDYEKAHVAELLEDWGPWKAFLATIWLEQGYPEADLAGLKILMPLHALAIFLTGDRNYELV